jgi:hypothetical protein
VTGLNTDWALAEQDNCITMTVMHNASSSSGGAVVITARNYTAAPDAEVTKEAQIVEKIFDRVIPAWRTDIENSKNNRWTSHREAAIRAREELVRAEEIKQNLGDDAPEISAANPHPWIWSGARSLWQSGHYVQAVRDAVTKLNAETQNKVGRRDVSETDLFKQSFSLDEAKSGKSRLRRMQSEDSDTYRSASGGRWRLLRVRGDSQSALA